MGPPKRIEIARITELPGDNSSTGGCTAFFVIGIVAMLLALLTETSAIRLAAWAAIWTGYNVMVGAYLVAGSRRLLIVTRELPTEPDAPGGHIAARSYPSWIAGLTYRAANGLDRARFCWQKLKPGDVLDLVREPENEHDEKAVAVMLGGAHLGYVPERHHWVARALDDGQTLRCTVENMSPRGVFVRRAKHVGLQIAVLD
jgi:hypothetical protein